MKHLIIIVLIFFATQPLLACPACEAQQPKLSRGITHGVAPQGDADYIIVSIMVCITLIALWYSAKSLLFPKEDSADHIKHSIIE